MVAAAAGVTTPTVSKVLNGRPDVAADTRSRVQQALRDFDYVPPATRSFKLQSRTVELVFSDYRNPYFGEILHGVTEQASTAGHRRVARSPHGQRPGLGSADGPGRSRGRDCGDLRAPPQSTCGLSRRPGTPPWS